MVGRVVVLWTQITTGVGVLAILYYGPFLHYNTYQYVAAAVIIFVSTNVLEGLFRSDIKFSFLCKRII